MPALDQCEPIIIKALEKEGWYILDKPYPIRIIQDGKVIFADMRLREREDERSIIVVEVKCFPTQRPMLDEFYHALGQYQIYRFGLELNQLDTPIYLAVPASVYEDFFAKALIQKAIEQLKVKLIIVDLESEVVTQWIE